MGTSLVGGGVTALRVLQQPLALRCQNWGLPTVPEVWSPHHQLRLLQDWGSHAHPPPRHCLATGAGRPGRMGVLGG